MDPIARMLALLETSETGAPASGTGETDGSHSDSSAGTENTDTGQGGGPPDTIPYSRFKEVNDQLSELRPFKELADVGYGADSLRQLAEFEAGFRADPVGTWFGIAKEIENLPPDIKEAVERHLQSDSKGGGKTQGDSSSQDGEDKPEWAKDLARKLDEHDNKLTAREQREVAEANNQLLDGIIAAWDELDEKAGLKSPDERKKLTFIIAHSRDAESVEDILKGARDEWLSLREETLGSALQPGGTGAPRSVPGGGAPVNAPDSPKTLAEASIRARQRLEQQ